METAVVKGRGEDTSKKRCGCAREVSRRRNRRLVLGLCGGRKVDGVGGKGGKDETKSTGMGGNEAEGIRRSETKTSKAAGKRERRQRSKGMRGGTRTASSENVGGRATAMLPGARKENERERARESKRKSDGVEMLWKDIDRWHCESMGRKRSTVPRNLEKKKVDGFENFHRVV